MRGQSNGRVHANSENSAGETAKAFGEWDTLSKLGCCRTFGRAFRSKGEMDAHKVIFGREKFAGGTSSLVSYEVSPFRGRS